MIKIIKKLFSQVDTETKTTKDNVTLAALALLIETGKADHSLDSDELDAVINLGIKTFGTAPDDVNELIALAHSSTDDATSLFEFTHQVNEHYDEQQKFNLIRSMWHIAYIDGKIDKYEEHLIRRVASLIYVDHVKFIEAKHLASEDASN